MDLIILNRLGIVLNFIASFLIAPELIGIERLRNWEKSLEEYLKAAKLSIEKKISVRENFFNPYKPEKPEKDASTLSWVLYWTMMFFYSSMVTAAQVLAVFFPVVILILIPIVYLIILFKAFIYCLLPLIIIYLIFLYSGIYDVIKNHHTMKKSLENLILIIIGPFLYVINILLISFYFFWSFLILGNLLKFSKNFLSFIIKLFDGDENLQTYLVSIGIFLLILGNLLQFIATF